MSIEYWPTFDFLLVDLASSTRVFSSLFLGESMRWFALAQPSSDTAILVFDPAVAKPVACVLLGSTSSLDLISWSLLATFSADTWIDEPKPPVVNPDEIILEPNDFEGPKASLVKLPEVLSTL